MQDKRIRLNDLDIDLIVAALSARLAATSGERRQHIRRLMSRLAEGGRGNPRLSLPEYTFCEHGVRLDALCGQCQPRPRRVARPDHS